MKPGKPIHPTPQELVLAQKLHAIGLEERRRVEGFSDGKTWEDASAGNKSALYRIARALLNWEVGIDFDSEIKRLNTVLASIHAATDLETARRRAYEGRTHAKASIPAALPHS